MNSYIVYLTWLECCIIHFQIRYDKLIKLGSVFGRLSHLQQPTSTTPHSSRPPCAQSKICYFRASIPPGLSTDPSKLNLLGAQLKAFIYYRGKMKRESFWNLLIKGFRVQPTPKSPFTPYTTSTHDPPRRQVDEIKLGTHLVAMFVVHALVEDVGRIASVRYA